MGVRVSAPPLTPGGNRFPWENGDARGKTIIFLRHFVALLAAQATWLIPVSHGLWQLIVAYRCIFARPYGMYADPSVENALDEALHRGKG